MPSPRAAVDGPLLSRRRAAHGRAAALAARRLARLGFAVAVDEAAALRVHRFAGDDETRLAAIHRIAAAAPAVAMATRGGYGLTRLLERIDWKALARSVDKARAGSATAT
jgi:muramoyltetrapeptide carboxypeptidase